MRLTVMRLLDRRLGPWLCRVLGLLYWLGSYRPAPGHHPEAPRPETVAEILIVKFMGLGSILQATPLIQALRQRYPGVRITLLTFRSNRALTELRLGFDEVIGVEVGSPWRLLKSHWLALRQLRARRFDLVLNLEFFATYAALMTALVRKRFALGFGGDAHHRNRFHDDLVSYECARHVQEKFLYFARRLGWEGATPPLARLHVEQPTTVLENAEAREHFRFPDGRTVILVNINTSDLAGQQRRWPREHFHTVLNQLTRRPDVSCVLIGGPGERAAAECFLAGLERPELVLDLTGRLSLRELVALMQLADLYLGNDSGPMHFAACVGLPILAFFGPESPGVYGPPLGGANTVLYRAEACSPCLNVYSDKHTYCRDNVCMKRILPEQVLEVLERRYLDGVVREPVGRKTLPLVHVH